MPKKIDLMQGTSKWLEWRKEKIGASDIAIIMGLSPYETAYQLWKRKIDGSDIEDNHHMKRGRDLEIIAREMINAKYGVNYEPACYQSSINENCICSLDGYCRDAMYPILEIKCPGPKDHAVAVMGQVPEHYYPQLQFQMWVMDENEVLYVSFDGAYCVEVVVKRDDIFIDKMIGFVECFWRCLIDFTPPMLTDKDLVTIVDPDAILKAEKLKMIKEKIKELESQEVEMEKDIINVCDGKNCQIGSLKAIQVVRKGNIQYGKIDMLKDVDLEQYRKPPVKYWKIA